MFTTDGDLTAETIARCTKIRAGTKMENAHLQGYFAAHGGAERWGKYGPRVLTFREEWERLTSTSTPTK